ncbi:MAG: YjgP/YjgQ family permease [Thermodesulfobacteria bacterium]|nr:YjgP/YjgQ family permease [Thermodesulfobacteriota bacterium]
MKLYVRYLLRPYLFMFLLLAFVLVGLYALVEFFDKLDNVTKAGVSSRILLEYLFYRLPQMLFDLWPIVVSLAGLLALAFLSRGGELLAFRTLGFSMGRLSWPYFLSALLFSLVFVFLSANLLPRATYRALYVWEVKVYKKEPRGLVVKGRLFFRGVNSFFTGHVLRPDATVLRDVTYARVDREGMPVFIIWAKKAYYRHGRWVFEKGLYKRAAQGMKPVWFQKKEFSLEFSPETVLVVKRIPRAQFLAELWSQREFLKEAGLPTTIPESEIAYRLFYPLAGPMLLLLSLPLLLGQRGRQALGRGLSLGLVAIVFGLAEVMGAKSLGDMGYLSPLVSMPLGLVLLLIEALLLFRLRRF